MRNNFYFEVILMKRCICTYNCPNKDMYSNVAANGLKLVSPFGIFQTWFFSLKLETEGCVILAAVGEGKQAIVMLNLSKKSGSRIDPLIPSWERLTLFSLYPWFCWNPLSKVSQPCAVGGMVLCKGPGVCLPAVGNDTSALYLSGLVEDKRPCPRPWAFPTCAGPLWKPDTCSLTAASQHCPAHWRRDEPSIWALTSWVSPFTRSTTSSLVCRQPHWKREACTNTPNVWVRLFCPPDLFAHRPRCDQIMLCSEPPRYV